MAKPINNISKFKGRSSLYVGDIRSKTPSSGIFSSCSSAGILKKPYNPSNLIIINFEYIAGDDFYLLDDSHLTLLQEVYYGT